MQLLKRVGYYLVGVAISMVGVVYFWQQKKATFDYGPDARTLKTIRVRKLLFSEEAKKSMKVLQIDSLKIDQILHNADVDFGKGAPRQKPCAAYFITGKKDLKNVSLLIKRCDSTATIETIILNVGN